MEDVFKLYQRKVALLSSAQKEKLYRAYDEGMSPFVIGCAILRAKQEQRRCRKRGEDKRISFNYINRIIEDWLNHGITTEERFHAYWTPIKEEEESKEVSWNAKKERPLTREDFTYEESPKQDRSLFPWLDD